jgi:predicted helicase
LFSSISVAMCAIIQSFRERRTTFFGIQTGVAISFFVRCRKAKGCSIRYLRRPEFDKADEKLAWLSTARLSELSPERIFPDDRGQWINLPNTDFDSLCAIASKQAKASTRTSTSGAIFKLYSLGVSTNRDDWVTAFSPEALSAQMSHFAARYHELLKRNGDYATDIKWSRNLKRRFKAGRTEPLDGQRIIKYAYRPFVSLAFYDSSLFIDERGSVDKIFPLQIGQRNVVIAFIGDATEKPFSALASETAADLNFLSPAAAGTKLLPLLRYENDTCVDNITDWSLDQFKKHYQPGRGKKERPITKEAIFHYVYGVVHDPVYREKYALNLKREFPRVSFYPDFWQWADWGKELMDLHIGYESVEPYVLKRTDASPSPQPSPRKRGERAAARAEAPRALLRADKEAGIIRLDSETVLTGIPPEAWDYKLGNRSALEWILDQYKEKTPKDPTIREKFNTYRFADYKEKVIDLLSRVTRVSVETVRIVEAMRAAKR